MRTVDIRPLTTHPWADAALQGARVRGREGVTRVVHAVVVGPLTTRLRE